MNGAPGDTTHPVKDRTGTNPNPDVHEASLLPRLTIARAVTVARPAARILDAFRIDLFYCEAPTAAVTDARKTRALAAEATIRKASKAQVRVRLLPVLVQARPGYQSFMDGIRFDVTGNERQAATQLAALVTIGPDAVQQVPSPTPGYLSVFYCASAAGR